MPGILPMGRVVVMIDEIHLTVRSGGDLPIRGQRTSSVRTAIFLLLLWITSGIYDTFGGRWARRFVINLVNGGVGGRIDGLDVASVATSFSLGGRMHGVASAAVKRGGVGEGKAAQVGIIFVDGRTSGIGDETGRRPERRTTALTGDNWFRWTRCPVQITVVFS